MLSVLVGWYGTSWGFSKTQKEERRRGHNGFCWSQCAVIEGTMGKSRLIGSSSTPVSPVSSPVSPPVSPVSPVSPFHSNILTIRVWSISIMSNFYWNHSWRSLGSASSILHLLSSECAVLVLTLGFKTFLWFEWYRIRQRKNLAQPF